MNEIVEESQRLANSIWPGYEITGSVTPVTPVYRYPPWYTFQEEVSKDRKIEKNPKT